MSKRVTQLTELTSPAVDDILPIVDTSTGITKKITYRNLVNIPDLGWASAGETWVYASATTFTVAGVDVTDKYPVGTKIRLKQGGSYKYFYIVTRVFSTNTTITVAAGSDYSLANSAITDNYFSYAAVATGFPGWFAFTPSWTNLTVGNGTNEGRFQMTGKTVTGMTQVIIGSSSAMGTGPYFVPPVTPANITNIAGENHPIGITVGNTTTAQFLGVTAFNNSISKIMPLYQATTTQLANITAAAPTAWPTTSFVVTRFTYEAA